MERFGKVFKILFIIVSILTVLEYMFVTGMFTSVLCLMLVDIVGVVNVIVSLKEKKFVLNSFNRHKHGLLETDVLRKRYSHVLIKADDSNAQRLKNA